MTAGSINNKIIILMHLGNGGQILYLIHATPCLD